MEEQVSRRRRSRPRPKTEEQSPVAELVTSTAKTITEPVASERPAMRPSMRMDNTDSVAAAERRAAELLEHGGTEIDGTDEFNIDRSIVPDGWDYQWRRKSVAGYEDPAYQVQLQQMGWQPVPASRHPEMMPSTGTWSIIERKGLVLMECPMIIVQRSRNRDRQNAAQQVRVKEAQLNSAPAGTFERGTHPGAPVKVNKSYAPLPVADS